MRAKVPFQRRFFRRVSLFLFAIFSLLLIYASPGQAAPPTPAAPSAFFSASGTLDAGDVIEPNYFVASGPLDFIFRLSVEGAGDVDFTILGSDAAVVWEDTVQGGEVVWGYGTLPAGNTTLALANSSASAADYDLTLYAAPTAPYSFAGSSAADGRSSAIELTFDQSGLYTFDFGVSSGRYQLRVADNYIRKVVEVADSVTLFVPAGTHEIAIIQDSSAGAEWSLAVSAVGAAADQLPYAQTGGEIGGAANDFDVDILPLHLDEPATVNIALTATGDAADQLTLAVGDAVHNLVGDSAAGGETVWITMDLPAGTSFLQLTAAGNSVPLSYAFTVNAVPIPDVTWSGVSAPAGQNSAVTFEIDAAGVYEFTLGLTSGRYQFAVNDGFLQKVVENAETVQFYLPAGTHLLTIRQDTVLGAHWSVGLTQISGDVDTLPYVRSGGTLGGPGNDFGAAWLPIAADGATTVNMKVTIAGATVDGVDVALFNSAAGATPDVVLDPVLGTEMVWATVELAAGINRLRLSAEGNGAGIGYEVSIEEVPPASAAVSWSGTALSAGQDSTFTVDFPASGTYRFAVETSSGAATILVDGQTAQESLDAFTYSYDLTVAAGAHVVSIAPDDAFPLTEWEATVTPVTAQPAFFTFEGTVPAGGDLEPAFLLDVGIGDFNYLIGADGAPVEVEVYAGSELQWADDVQAGERLWGTGTLPPGMVRVVVKNASGAPADVSITFFDLPTAPHSWDGVADPAGSNSEIRVEFPTDGLYTFDLGRSSGRYQLRVAEEHIRRTVELTGTVTLFVPAGTHPITVDQDSSTGAVWNIAVSAAGEAADTLPYAQQGGTLGGPGNDFSAERLPIYLEQPTSVNVAVTVTGDPEPLNVAFAGGATLAAPAGFQVLGGETRWQSVDLPAGITYLELDAGGAASGLSYDVALSAVPEPAYAWSGTAAAAGGESVLRMDFPSDGLYTFDLSATGGDIAFAVGDSFARKLAVGADAPQMTVFVAAGTQTLHLMNDGASDTEWSVDVSAVGAAADTLPYTQSSTTLKPEAGFDEEWFPFYSGELTPANVRLEVTGDSADALFVELYDGFATITPTRTVGPLHGGESVWFTVDLPADGARMRFVADAGNGGDLGYQVTAYAVPAITGTTDDSFVWDGAAAGEAISSEVRIDTRISGVYHLEMVMPVGFAALYVDEAPPPTSLDSTVVAFDLELEAGEHTFIVDPADNFAETVWEVTVTLAEADAPQVSATDPVSVTDEVATPVTISGANFMPDAAVALVDGSDTYPLESVTYVSAVELSGVVPAGLPLGTYDVVVTNPDDQSGTLAGSFTIFRQTFYIYLPLVLRP